MIPDNATDERYPSGVVIDEDDIKLAAIREMLPPFIRYFQELGWNQCNIADVLEGILQEGDLTVCHICRRIDYNHALPNEDAMCRYCTKYVIAEELAEDNHRSYINKWLRNA